MYGHWCLVMYNIRMINPTLKVDYGPIIGPLWNKKIVRATKYYSPAFVVRATRRVQSRSKIEVVLTMGRPNYRDRDFIKRCKKAGEPFPIKKIQYKFETAKKK